MKPKIVTIDGKNYAELDGEKPIFIHPDGKEAAFDVPDMYARLLRDGKRNSDLQKKLETTEATLRAFEGIDDAEAAKKALETIKNLDEGKLLSAGRVEEIKAMASKAAEDRILAAQKQLTEKIATIEKERDNLRSDLYSEKIGGSFNRSKLIADKFAIPADMVQARFGQNFKVEDGKIIAYDSMGNKVPSHSKPGELAEFDEALEILVSAYPYKDHILKGANNSGSGARSSNGAGGAGGKTMRYSEFNALPLRQQALLMNSKDGPPTLVDE
jgi:hypothetical protein